MSMSVSLQAIKMIKTSDQVLQTESQTTRAKQKKQRQRNRPRNKRNRVEDSTTTANNTTKSSTTDSAPTESAMPGDNSQQDATREQVMAEREAKKQAKQAKKQKATTPATKIITEVEQTTITTKLTTTITTTARDKPEPPAGTAEPAAPIAAVTCPASTGTETGDKTRDQIKAEREAKKAAKQAAKAAKSSGTKVEPPVQKLANLKVTDKTPTLTAAPSSAADDDKKKPALSKAERRALQEAQRAAKAQGQGQVKKAQPAVKAPGAGTVLKELKRESVSPVKSATSSSPSKNSLITAKSECKVKLFNHLVCAEKGASLFINDPLVHPSMARLGVQYAQRTVVGSNARCIAFLHALRQVVQDFETPAKKEFGRSLDAAVKHHVDHLHKCRPLAVSVSNAYKQFRNQVTQLPADVPEAELKELLVHFIDTYMENQIGKAAQAISSSLQEKITDGDVLLTFGCSSLIQFICEEAKRRQVAFRVIVVDSRPTCEGQEMLRRLHAHGIPCTYVLINAVGYVMAEATKVLLGAHALLANGYVMARTGTAQVALVANAHNVPVLVCCETHKFSERFQTDAIVYNELSDPNDLVRDDKCCLKNWTAKAHLTPLNLNYDITPPELVSAVVTEVAILPCTSVPVILRIKPEIGY
ncbi:translation initiation factor eIF-2B subunit delta isoform X1 [Drosophila pseudoobscura]|uniref:Translation initiation factor eIF2B subunit delta n=2 Tax=Drosophila pseudoobscura pseudoobscura TaxID=46245 RepID=A0A6I8VRS2_DROPS|nr:translation initiation factor eIF-2B subunit delta isoform X1 [Drosophila pseudoobscura]